MKDQGSLAQAGTVLSGSDPAGEGLRRCKLCGGEFPSDFVVCPRDATPLGPTISNDDPLIGAVLGGTYRIVRILGGGAMGRLYEAEHARMDRRFAIKVIQEVYAKIPDLVARFDREARALSRIRSDHVVDVIDVLKTPDGRPSIVAEKLEGEDLQQRLDREERLKPADAIPLARQMCRGLAAAHAIGVIHRDLKPSNVFLTKAADGTTVVKLVDFGVAKLADDPQLTRTGAVVGTPMYMSPEQARGSSDVDARSDVYSIGAVLYRMLTGRPPYEGNDPTATIVRVLEEDPPRPRSLDKTIPEGLEVVVQRAMARDPKKRPASVVELERQLAAFETPSSGATRHGAALERGTRSGTDGASADELTRRARLARPTAVALGLPAAVSGGLLVTALIGTLVSLLRAGTVPSDSEKILMLLPGGASLLVTLVAYIQALRTRWRSAVAVEEYVARVARSMMLGVGTLGALELCIRTWDAVTGTVYAQSPGYAAARIALAGIVGGVFYVLRKGR